MGYKKHSKVIYLLLLNIFLSSGFAAETIVHLFEWKWKDIGQECEQFLGPMGYTAVQISPPQEHINVDTWWARYQPVSYKLESRSGNLNEFKEMIWRCNRAGVKVFADAVINHMANGQGIGVAGTNFRKFYYPEYSREHFNISCSITSYLDRWQVQNCDLQGLPDLKTEDQEVQRRIANYLNTLISFGISGFRIDAGKHIPAHHINQILAKLSRRVFIYQEVIDLGTEPIRAHEYFQNGHVTEFKYGQQLSKTFLAGKLAWLQFFGDKWGFMPSGKAISFIDNHDNQRGHGGGGYLLTHNQSRPYALSHVFMLAWPYGTPRVMSSFRFHSPDQGPPHSYIHGNGRVNCFNEWVCEHRWTAISNMVNFRKAVHNAPVTNWWSNGENQIAFSRGNRGFVVINNEEYEMSQWMFTGLPQGTYCDMIKNGYVTRGCQGKTVTVNQDGWAYVEIPAKDALAIHVGKKLE